MSIHQLRIIYPDVPDNFRTRVDAQWLTYSGGRLEALTDAARSDAAAAATDIDTVRADVRLEIARAYWSLVTALESVQVVDESLARVGRHLVDVRNQLAAGLVPPNDVLTVEAQESRQRMLSIQARANRDVAEAELGRLIGVGPGTRIQTASRLENNANNANNADSAGNTAPSDPRVPTLGGLLETARQNRPERKALLQRLEAAGGRHRAALAASKPTIAIAGGVDYARPNPRIFPREATWRESWDASINLSWPLFDGGRTVAEIKGAVATERAIAARLGEFDAALGLELRQRLSEIEANRAAIAAAEDGVRAATEARRVVGERFAAGVATSSDVLDAQVAVLQAGLDRTQALASRRIAEARLARSLGSR